MRTHEIHTLSSQILTEVFFTCLPQKKALPRMPHSPLMDSSPSECSFHHWLPDLTLVKVKKKGAQRPACSTLCGSG